MCITSSPDTIFSKNTYPGYLKLSLGGNFENCHSKYIANVISLGKQSSYVDIFANETYVPYNFDIYVPEHGNGLPPKINVP